jgi:hypothetical protein
MKLDEYGWLRHYWSKLSSRGSLNDNRQLNASLSGCLIRIDICMQPREGCECRAAPAGVPRQHSQSLLERVWQLGSVRNEAGRLARATVGRSSAKAKLGHCRT